MEICVNLRPKSSASNTLRIALYHNLPSGGAKRLLYETTRRLAEAHHLDLYTPEGADTAYCDIRPWVENHFTFPLPIWDLSRLGSPFKRLRRAADWLRLVRLYRLSAQIAQTIDRRGYDVVLAHGCRITQAPLLLLFLHTPSLYYCNEPLRWAYEPVPYRPYWPDRIVDRIAERLDVMNASYLYAVKMLDRKSIRSATLVLTNSRFTQAAVRRIYGVASRLCYPGVDAGLFRPLPVARENTVLSVGSLTPHKGNDLIVRGVARIPEPLRPSVTFISHTGLAEEREYLRQLAARLGVAVRFLRAVDDESLVRWYNTARLTACTPHREPFGLVALEGMACGRPVVGVREGGVAETVQDGRTGLLVERDPAQFAGAVRTLLEDESLARRYGEAGRTCVEERWSWERTTSRLNDAIQETA